MTETCTRKDFAARMGWRSQGQVSNLIKDGLIALTDDGKLVKVAESIAAIEAARDPDKDGVRARHEAARAGVSHELPALQESKAKIAKYDALEREKAFLTDANELVVKSLSVLEATTAATEVRVALEPLGAVLAPQLAAAADEASCRALVDDRIEVILGELSRRFYQLHAESHRRK